MAIVFTHETHSTNRVTGGVKFFYKDFHGDALAVVSCQEFSREIRLQMK